VDEGRERASAELPFIERERGRQEGARGGRWAAAPSTPLMVSAVVKRKWGRGEVTRGRGTGTSGGFRRSGDEEALGWFGTGSGRLGRCGIVAEVTRLEEEEEGDIGGPCV
jgi:hypothetical protein